MHKPKGFHVHASDILKKQKTEYDALRSARNRWRGSDFSRGESEDPYFRRCFETTDPLDEHFKTLSLDLNRCLNIYPGLQVCSGLL